MAKIITVTASDGTTVRFFDEVKAQGGVKDVMFSPDKSYVVAFYREKATAATRERLLEITGRYRENIFNKEGGSYLQKLFCWPSAVVEHNQRLGVVVPFYRDIFFFKHGSQNNDQLGIRHKEKVGKWFATPTHRAKYLDSRELGDWRLHLQVCLMLARAVRRMHMAGLSHSDLGYNNCLVDPTTGQACLIDLDGLVVPGKHPPSVIGTPDFIAPEVVKTAHMPIGDADRKLPSRVTDLHALAVMIYMYLLYRHPLRGDKFHDTDASRDDELMMGERALFIEHPQDASNRIKPANLKSSELPWKDTAKIPYSVTGPYLSELFSRAFVNGLHNPLQRPAAEEWETALVKTVDLLQPCANSACGQKWYPFDNTYAPRCPFCGTPHQGKLPVLNLYSPVTQGKFMPDGHRVMVYSGQSLFRWHENRFIFPNEKLQEQDAKRVGYFQQHHGNWYLVNERLTSMRNMSTKTPIAPGESVLLEEGLQILLSTDAGGRLVAVQMAGAG
ncbi:helix-hairpin-helix domain-containing protein [Rivihabitans pingtungensis]|uniref:Protein kinase-like protein n=1 Tax=Rivihabitans pingtungensis TaxID=1054498 RepID=A0A318KRA0_9NEIS|nr:lipopolysaccharide kinase InaA family protein [Rivihabitans pingtungensis]PXX74489.1 protein kinase-like protein [Rivihabitans pingtungensis]